MFYLFTLPIFPKISEAIMKKFRLYHIGIHLPESHTMCCLWCSHRHFHQFVVWNCTYSIWLSKVVKTNQQSILDALLPLCHEYSFLSGNIFLQTSSKLCCCINCCISTFPIYPELAQLNRSRFEFKAQLKSPPIKVWVLGSSQLFILAINLTL